MRQTVLDHRKLNNNQKLEEEMEIPEFKPL